MSFNDKLRDEMLAREQFDALLEAKVLIEPWRRHFNAVRMLLHEPISCD